MSLLLVKVCCKSRHRFFISLQLQESFLGECGLRHESCAVRSRLCYFFVRLIKSLKYAQRYATGLYAELLFFSPLDVCLFQRNQVAPVAEEILKNLQELLVMLPVS